MSNLEKACHVLLIAVKQGDLTIFSESGSDYLQAIENALNEKNNQVSEVSNQPKYTPRPWRWEFIPTAGNEYLVSGDGSNLKFCDTRPDKNLQAAAPDMYELLKEQDAYFRKFYEAGCFDPD